ncbi:MAG TPA: hypothetical protein VH375_03600, partial [Rhodanobacteraceae bacterium]
QRKLLTVLFGQSGLGKTSLLRAGLVPRLRAEGLCPIYVRIDYAPESPPPSEQIKQAIFRATATAGYWTRPGSAIEGESLWEFLHHRGDLLRDEQGRTLLPFLIFDQFEEIFTLGQADDAGRLRAKAFLTDLADLVENRPPAALEARLDRDDSAIEDFDFARADYRILIALREDYLAHLESVKSIMPSVTQNRMRLARMNGAQALTAVLKPGGRLVSQEVAESIVRFVAGGSELANAEIEPSLLSLVCRELNTTRIAHGDAEISAALLAGSRDTILSEFYERALSDQPAGVRRVIEDDLLTESGYRESLAEERVNKALVAAGAAPDALATLVNRRLLRIEERLDVRRVELTHDVLCSVVAASRTLRREREARDEAERQLAAQREREAASHRALVRARAIAAVCAVLMILAAAGAAYGWISQRRAHVAEMEAQKSRSEAEKLVSFLIEDFYAELEPTGRLETLGKLAEMTVNYYDGLPPELVTPRTQVFRAMALVREGAAQQYSGNIEHGLKLLGEAERVFRALYDGGDHSEPVTYGLALALFSQGYTVISAAGSGTVAQLEEAARLLRPLVYSQDPPRAARKLYADTLNYYSHTQPREAAVAICAEARKVLVGLGALDLTDLNAAASYADTADSEARHLLSLGRVDEAKQLETEVYEVAEKVLVQRPGDLHALSDRSYAAELLGRLAARMHDSQRAMEYTQRAALSGENEVRFNPSDVTSWQRWSLALTAVSDRQFENGDITQAIATQRSVLALGEDKRRPSSLAPVLWYHWIKLAFLEAETGDAAAAAAAVKAFERDAAELLTRLSADDARRPFFVDPGKGVLANVQLIEGSAQTALTSAAAVLERTEAIDVPKGDLSAQVFKSGILRGNYITASRAAIRLGRYHEAETFARKLLEVPDDPTSESDPRQRHAEDATFLAHAIAMQGRGAEALTVLAPALEYYREEQRRGASETEFRGDFAYALCVDAIARSDNAAERAHRAASLDEAQRTLDGASAEAKRMASFRQLANLIATTRG